MISDYNGKIQNPWEKGSESKSAYENPFKNQRAREKWNRFMAKEGKSTTYTGKLNNPTNGGLKRLDTYQRIYGKEKELPDLDNDDDLNDREGVFISPVKQ